MTSMEHLDLSLEPIDVMETSMLDPNDDDLFAADPLLAPVPIEID